jgi:hypothetical protein
MTSFPPVSKVNAQFRLALRGVVADLLAVFTLTILFGFMWWGQ